MTKDDLLREVTPLSAEDCFLVIKRPKPGFSYPQHIHPEFELNFLERANGALRIVGDSVEEIGELDLVLIGGEIKHAWSTHKCTSKDISEITIQFHASLFDSMKDRRLFRSVKEMFENASRGIVFSQEIIQKIKPELQALSNDEQEGFRNLLRLIDILKNLSLDKNSRILAASSSVGVNNSFENQRLKRILLFLHENYQREITLEEVAKLVSMSEASLTRFLKKQTGKTFIDNLNDIRIGETIGRLITSNDTISEICYGCGFNNLSNFNRIFKKKKGLTPREYRDKHVRTRFLI